jgi:hypothetical protein
MKREYDFSKARRRPVVPVPTGKTRITIRLDDDVLNWFRKQVHAAGGGNYQTRSITPCASSYGTEGRRSRTRFVVCCAKSFTSVREKLLTPVLGRCNVLRLSGRRPLAQGRDALVARRSAPTDGSKRPTAAKVTTPLDASADTDRSDSRLAGRHAQWCPIEPPSGLQIECG